jgi:hypothetical protein
VLPQLIVRWPLQRSVTVLSPQEPTPQFPFTSCVFVSGTHAHAPFASQDWFAPHAPQVTVRVAPQLSAPCTFPQTREPQRRAARLPSLSGVQPHTFAVPGFPPPHVAPRAEHVLPQLSVPPHPSAMLPQFLPCAAHVVGVQPHTFDVPPPPQLFTPAHAPHATFVRRFPHESGPVTAPQFFPRRAQNCAAVSGVHPHTFA